MPEHPDLNFVPRRVQTDPVAEALELFPYALYIVGSRGSDNINGMMADWVMQVSFEPRLVVVALERTATTLRNLKETGVFTVNVLNTPDIEIARKFAQPRAASKIVGRSETGAAVIHDKLRDVPYQRGPLTECPILDAALGYIECEVESFSEAGDHVLALGRVIGGAALRDGNPLISRDLGWSYAG
jgi:flavin reductase (DIM6/NTAB) family NADH-FMN oxidoreductase RutF